MLDTLKEIVGAEPQYHEDGNYYTPSKAALKVMCPKKTNYTPKDYPNAYTGGDLKILVPCVDDHIMTCANDKLFYSGDHPVEVFVTLKQLHDAGFSFDFATPSGNPVVFEDWATPTEDETIMSFIEYLRPLYEAPLKLSDVESGLGDSFNYLSVFFPGGQKVVDELPTSTTVKNIINWFRSNDKYIITICHGPSALLSLAIDEDPAEFPYKGYEIEGFPKSGDAIAPSVGYLPGDMPYYYQDKLEELGVKIRTMLPTGHAHIDRKLITGDAPMGANKLGILAAETLLASLIV